jgi:hypothetical protein
VEQSKAVNDMARLTETFLVIGIPFTVSQLSSREHVVELKDETFGGYSGFFTLFTFDDNGTFIRGDVPDSHTGIWE